MSPITGKQDAVEEASTTARRAAQHPEILGREQHGRHPPVEVSGRAHELAVGVGGSPRRPCAAVERDRERRRDADDRIEPGDLDPRRGLAVADERPELGAAKRADCADEVERLEQVGLARAVVPVQDREARAQLKVGGGEVAKLADAEARKEHVAPLTRPRDDGVRSPWPRPKRRRGALQVHTRRSR